MAAAALESVKYIAFSNIAAQQDRLLYCFNGSLYYFFLSLAAEHEEEPILLITIVRIIVISSVSQNLDSKGSFW